MVKVKNPERVFKEPLYMTAWLDVALEKEKEKYEICPIVPDMAAGYDEAQAWGYIVTGYFLAEQSFKALLYLREKGSAQDAPAVDAVPFVRWQRPK